MNTNKQEAANMPIPKNEFDKVIFLDIEGVIVTHRSIIVQHDDASGERYHGGRAGWHRFIDNIAMGLVYKLAHDFNARIVLTSTLRGMFETIPGLWAVAPHWCKDPTEYVATAHTEFLDTREAGITKFVKDFGVRKYVVFDDTHLTCPNFIRCKPSNGIDYSVYQDAKPFLAEDEETLQYEAIFL